MSQLFQGAAALYAARKFGGMMEDKVETQSIGVSATSVIPNDPERVFLLLVNLSTNLMYVGFDNSVSSSKGIFLAANGGSYEVDVETDLVIPTYQHWVVSAGAASDLLVMSLRRFSSDIIEES